MKLLLIVLVILGIIFLGIYNKGFIIKYLEDEKITSIDCNKPFDVIYLKASEISFASSISNNINGVVVIPELNRVIARTEILKCPKFNYADYLKTFN